MRCLQMIFVAVGPMHDSSEEQWKIRPRRPPRQIQCTGGAPAALSWLAEWRTPAKLARHIIGEIQHLKPIAGAGIAATQQLHLNLIMCWASTRGAESSASA